MRRALYIGSAALAAAGVAFYLRLLTPYIANTASLWDRPALWYPFVSRLVQLGAIIVFVIFALVQLKKSTPRLMLLLSGAVLFDSISLIAYSQWFGLFFLAAGIIPAILEISRVPKPVGKPTMVREKYEGLLMAAGVIGILSAAYLIITAISLTFTYINLKIFIPVYLYTYAMSVSGIVQCVCVGAFCFRKELRASVLYRMFFVGSAAVNVLLMPVSIAYYCIQQIYVFSNIAQLALITAMVLLVLIHTVKTRRFSLLPQECPIPQPYDPSFTVSG